MYYFAELICDGSKEGLFRIPSGIPSEVLKVRFETYCDADDCEELEFEDWHEKHYNVSVERIEYYTFRVCH